MKSVSTNENKFNVCNNQVYKIDKKCNLNFFSKSFLNWDFDQHNAMPIQQIVPNKYFSNFALLETWQSPQKGDASVQTLDDMASRQL